MDQYRDLSAWRVKIPKLATRTSLGKVTFVYVIEVQRIDIASKKGCPPPPFPESPEMFPYILIYFRCFRKTATTTTADNGEDLSWTVERGYSEFYALESKLTEFHGEFPDLRLPPRPKIFFGRGLDAMQSKIRPFQDYLVGLLLKPSLRGSDLLFTFLTSADEFTGAVASTNLVGLGNKIMKNVKLTKEKGQALQPFIDNFVASTLSGPPRPRFGLKEQAKNRSRIYPS